MVLAADLSRTPQAVPLRRSLPRTVPQGARFAEGVLAGANTFVFSSEIFDVTRAAMEAHGGEEMDIADAVVALAETHGRVEAVGATGWSKRTSAARCQISVIVAARSS